MCSLNWILVLTLAHLHYLAAVPVWEAWKMKQLQQVIENLKTTSCEGSTFYSPSNFKANCILSALNCTMTELKVAQNECFANDIYMQSALKAEMLIHLFLIDRLATSTEHATDCTQCEGYEEKGYNEFINDLLSLTYELNSQYDKKKQP